MVVFIVLWPYLLTTKLKSVIRHNLGHSNVQPLEKDYTMVLTGCQTNSNREFALKQKDNLLGFKMRFSLIIFIIITKKEIKLSTVHHYVQNSWNFQPYLS